MNTLGIHFGHDANASLVKHGKVVADIMEERFNRVKHSSDPPRSALNACLDIGEIDISSVNNIAVAGSSLPSLFHTVFKTTESSSEEVPCYHDRFQLNSGIRISCYDHHQCHAATAYYTTANHKPALVVVSDGFGDDCSISFWRGDGTELTLIKKYPAEGSLGWFYSNVTEALGWIHGDGEGKTMALAAGDYPPAAYDVLNKFCPQYQDGDLIHPHYFGKINKLVERGAYQWHLKDSYDIKSLLTRFSASELASAAQTHLEEQHLSLCRYWLKETGLKRLCLAGGVFLNIILNRKLSSLTSPEDFYVFPNPADSGLALGAALCAVSEHRKESISFEYPTPYLGPSFENKEIQQLLTLTKSNYYKLDDSDLCKTVASALADNKCIGWFQDRMESGPRALGNRSILMSPIKASHQEFINRNIKFRERFRPFCPSLLAEDRNRYLVETNNAPYMILAFNTPKKIRSSIAAVVHSDGTIRPQIVTKKSNPLYHKLLTSFKTITGEGILLNTSFNIKGEPIVCTPLDALRCFHTSGMDMLVLGNFIINKTTT